MSIDRTQSIILSYSHLSQLHQISSPNSLSRSATKSGSTSSPHKQGTSKSTPRGISDQKSFASLKSQTTPPRTKLPRGIFMEPLTSRSCGPVYRYAETQEMFWRHNNLVSYPTSRGFTSQHSDILEEELRNVKYMRFKIDFRLIA